MITGQTAPPGHQPHRQATPESVLAGILQREDGDMSATEQIRHAQEWAGGTGHLLHLWSAATRPALYPDIDQQITARLTGSQAWRYQREYSRQALQQQLRAAQLAGHDIGALIDQTTAAPLDGARSISSVLHGRLQQAALPEPSHDVTWSQRTPRDAPEVARELAAGLDDRIRELGERMIERSQPWLLKHLGVLAPGASPPLREDYARRAGIAAGYREAAGITDPGQAVSPQPHRANPELDAMRSSTMKALVIPENPYATMTRGELEARILDGERAQAAAPPEVSAQLRLTAQAEAEAWRQSADAAAAHDQAAAANAQALARQMVAEKTRLEAMNAAYEAWSDRTSTARDIAAQAKAELGRRGHAQPADKPPTMAGWWRQFEADLDSMERAIVREHQAAIAAAGTSPGRRSTPHRPEPHKLRQLRPLRGSSATGTLPSPTRTRRSPPQDPRRRDTQALARQHEPCDRSARLDALQARADQAAHRIAADNTKREARAQYTARLERQAHAQAEPAAERQAEASDGIEIEL